MVGIQYDGMFHNKRGNLKLFRSSRCSHKTAWSNKGGILGDFRPTTKLRRLQQISFFHWEGLGLNKVEEMLFSIFKFRGIGDGSSASLVQATLRQKAQHIVCNAQEFLVRAILLPLESFCNCSLVC